MQSHFFYSLDDLKQITCDILGRAKLAGATACEAEVSEGFGQNVTVRQGDVETIEYNRDKGLGVTVYIGHQRGHASSSDLSPKALKDAVDAAVSIARYTASDPYSGLAEASLLAKHSLDLDLYHPWDMPVESAIELGKACEAAALGFDPRITNSEGATISTQESLFVYGNSLGFLNGYPTSRHAISCAVIAEDSSMQRDYWYTTARDPRDLDPADAVGRKAGERSVRRLGARKIDTAEMPVIFEAPVAAGLIGNFVSAISGGSLYRKASFLLDSLGQQVFAPHVQIAEEPHLAKGLASSPFDNEGVATQPRLVVRDGVLEGYMLSSYSARKLGMTSTANAGGNHNLIVSDGAGDLAAMLKQMNRGVLVTELLGHGTNLVTGDYSRGAAGFWVDQGEIQYPVEEITVAGNLRAMLKDIVAIGNDAVVRGSKQCGSILVGRMMVAGN